jgi:NADP-dependent 3-hydroxy acid dehydrogenase YdfG
LRFFNDKVALVTGAGSGIGQALSEALIAGGAHVVSTDIDLDRIPFPQGSGKDLRFNTEHLDVTDGKAFEHIVSRTMSIYGRLDFLFNNAGIAVKGEAIDYHPEDWFEVMDVNLNGVINGIMAAYPLMVRQGFGHIVNVASIEGLIPMPFSVSYVTSKYAVVGLSQALRIEAADLGVKVNVVCPALVKTRIFEDSRSVGNRGFDSINEILNRFGISSEQCARSILNGVKANKEVIMIPRAVGCLWLIQRLFPKILPGLMCLKLRKFRKELSS